MIKFLLNILKIFISIYFCILIVISAYYVTQKEIYEKEYPLLNDYSYIKVDSDNLEPDYKKNDFVFVKKEENLKVGDYIVYIEKSKTNIIRFKKIKNIDNYLITLYYPNSSDKEVTIEVKDVIAKAVYSNDTVSLILNILTNPVVLIALFVILVLLPEATYRRYN